MTNYNWSKIRKYLALEVMGWELIKGDYRTEAPEDTQHDYDFHQIRSDWRPDKNLNQSKQIIEGRFDSGLWFDNFHSEGVWQANIWPEGSARAFFEKHSNLAKAICLAVLKASGAYLSDFELDSEEEDEK